jgi:hypothetical protein
MTRNRVSRKAAAAPWWGWVIYLALLGGGLWFTVRWSIQDPVGVAVFAVFGGLFAVLIVRFPRVEARINAGLSGYLRMTAWFFAVLLPVVGALWLSEIVARSSLAFALGVLLTWLVVFCLVLRGLSTEARRDRVWKSLSRVGLVAPFVYVFVVTLIAIVLFSTLAFVLVDRELIHFGTDQSVARIAEPGDALDFFVWHALDSIPALEITGTMRWDEPLNYDDPGVGLLLLIFRVVVIAPVVAAFVSFWRYRRKLMA